MFSMINHGAKGPLNGIGTFQDQGLGPCFSIAHGKFSLGAMNYIHRHKNFDPPCSKRAGECYWNVPGTGTGTLLLNCSQKIQAGTPRTVFTGTKGALRTQPPRVTEIIGACHHPLYSLLDLLLRFALLSASQILPRKIPRHASLSLPMPSEIGRL
jgi:hypothetical protein